MALEIKSGSAVTRSDASGIRAFRESLKKNNTWCGASYCTPAKRVRWTTTSWRCPGVGWFPQAEMASTGGDGWRRPRIAVIRFHNPDEPGDAAKGARIFPRIVRAFSTPWRSDIAEPCSRFLCRKLPTKFPTIVRRRMPLPNVQALIRAFSTPWSRQDRRDHFDFAARNRIRALHPSR